MLKSYNSTWTLNVQVECAIKKYVQHWMSHTYEICVFKKKNKLGKARTGVIKTGLTGRY